MKENIQSALGRLRDEFLAHLPERIDTLQALLEKVEQGNNNSLEPLHRAAHSLVGTAGTHRLLNVSRAARELESMAAVLSVHAPVSASDLKAMHAMLANLAVQAANPLYDLVPESQKRSTSALIMVVEDDREQAAWLRSVLEGAGYQVALFETLEDFCVAVKTQEAPAAVIMDMVFPEGDDAGARTIAEMKVGSLLVVPVIFLSVRQDIAAKLAAHRAGATRYLTKPINQQLLLRTIADSAALTPHTPYRVLMVDDQKSQLQVNAHLLQLAGMEIRALENPLLVPDFLQEFAAEVLLVDMHMPECSGAELAAILRDDPRYAAIPIVYLSAETDVSAQLLALDRGGDHFLVKPVNPSHLVAVVGMHARRFRQSLEQEQSLRTAMYGYERHRQALDEHAIVSEADAAGNIVFVNDKFCEISGYAREELLGQNHRIVKSGLHPVSFYDDMWHTISAGKVWQGEVCNRSKNGELYWVETSIVPFLDESGLPYQYISIRTDITHVKAAELAQGKLKERLSQGQLFANIGTWDWNIQTGGLIWSERIAPLFGYPEGNLATTYENFLAAVHPEDRQAVIEAVSACVERDATYNIEHRVVWPDGTERWLLERGGVQRDPEGKPLQMLGVVQDIDDRKRAELALSEREHQLREAQALARIGNWSANIVTGELSWSDEIYRIFGHEPGSFAPSVAAFHAAIHPEDHELVEESERLAQKTGIHNVVHRIVLPDGTVRHVHELAQAEIDATGKILRMTGTVQDITEQVEVEQALVAARNEADRANHAKSEFLSSMSHELRTPMNAILGFGQLLQYDQTLTAAQQDNVTEITKAGDHLLELINEVLDLAKVESGQIDLSLEPVELCPIVDECLSLISIIAERRSIKISRNDLKGVAVRADSTRLKQILLNLLSNAVKYNREGGTVHLEVTMHGSDRIRILVKDSGQGIAAGRLQEIFQPFNRLDAEDSGIEGTGIGLTITRRIVEMMGGTVDVNSEVGVGSTFWIELPLEAMTPQEVLPDSGKLDKLSQSDSVAKYTILYIEDNPSNLRLMTQVLGRRQHIHLITAHTPELGIELALARRPALILLDINMPGMDGYQVLKVLKAEASLAQIPVIAITANAMARDIERGMAAGFCDYLTKPLDILLVNSTLDQHLLKHTQQ